MSMRRSTAAPGKENADVNIVHKRTRRTALKVSKIEIGIGIGESLEETNSTKSKSCDTPKSEWSRIPETLTCPPAPRKPTRRVQALSRKRKLMAEFEFFEADRREEVDEFLRSSFERISAARAARRRNVVVAASTPPPAPAESSCSSSSSPLPLPPLTCN